MHWPFPLVADGTRLGALLVAMPASVQLELDEQLVGAVADLAAASLAHERRWRSRSRRRGATLSLTGLPNRRAFDEQLDKLLVENGDNNPVTVTLLDVDGFKDVNDTPAPRRRGRSARNARRIS